MAKRPFVREVVVGGKAVGAKRLILRRWFIYLFRVVVIETPVRLTMLPMTHWASS